MRKETRKLLTDLEDAQWFQAVGQADSSGVSFVHSWKEAIDLANTEVWQDIRTEKQNLIRGELPQARLNLWNELVGQIDPDVCEMVAAKTRHLRSQKAEVANIANFVSWDLVHACLEWEYDDVIYTRFYRDVAEWYLRGHFPCGYSERGEAGVHILF
jgi:hypothetical protein